MVDELRGYTEALARLTRHKRHSVPTLRFCCPQRDLCSWVGDLDTTAYLGYIVGKPRLNR